MVTGSRHVRHTQQTPQRAQLGRRERWCAAEYRINTGWVSCFTRQGGKRGMDEDHEDQAVWRLGPGFQHGDRGRGSGLGDEEKRGPWTARLQVSPQLVWWWGAEKKWPWVAWAVGQPAACLVVCWCFSLDDMWLDDLQLVYWGERGDDGWGCWHQLGCRRLEKDLPPPPIPHGLRPKTLGFLTSYPPPPPHPPPHVVLIHLTPGFTLPNMQTYYKHFSHHLLF